MSARTSLIFHTGALGDFVLTWPLALALQRLYPDEPVVYITHPSKGHLATRLLQTATFSSETLGWHTLYGEGPSLQVQARDLLSRAGRIFSFGAAERDRFVQNLEQFAPDACIWPLVSLPPAGFAAHATSFLHQQLARDSSLAEAFEGAIHKLSTQGLPVPRATSQRILLHPGAGSVRKCWSLEYYLEVATRLREEGRPVEFVLGEAELERFPQRLMEDLSAAFPVHRPGDYIQLAEELLNCRLLITNDNGPGHLATMLGTTTLSLFGPTDPAVWRPIGPRAQVIHGMPLNSITPTAVLEALGSI